MNEVIEDPTSGKLKKKRRNKRPKSKRKRRVKRKLNAKRNVKRRPRAKGRLPPPVINIDNTTYWPIGNEEEIPHRPRAPRKVGPAGQRALEAREIRIVHTYEAQRDAGGVPHTAPPIGNVDDNAPAVQIIDPPARTQSPPSTPAYDRDGLAEELESQNRLSRRRSFVPGMTDLELRMFQSP